MRRPAGSRGFTLIELMVVVMILGVLAFMGVPQYLKTVETAKADDAVALVNMLGQANRIYNVNNETSGTPWTSGLLDNSHSLISNKYVGMAIARRMAMIKTTTISSMSVKPSSLRRSTPAYRPFPRRTGATTTR